MANRMQAVAEALKDQRAQSDPISQSRKDRIQNPARVLEALEKLRAIILDKTPTEELDCDLEVAHGLVSGLIGAAKANELIEGIPDLRRCLSMDVEATYERDPAANSYAEVVASYPSILAVSTYRIAHLFYEVDEFEVARIMSEDAHSRTGIDIHPGARIGCHFFIDHGTGVVIGETTLIGNRVKLYHGVTLAAFSNRKGRTDRGKKRHPTIEDDVTIYPNVTILGGETLIGKGSVVGGNSWITQPIPPNTKVVADPPSLQMITEGSDYQI